MTRPDISGIAPFFIVKNVPAALSFYRDRLGFDITFQGPADDIFFGIVQRGTAMIMFKDVGVDPLPNPEREPGARWDAPPTSAGRRSAWPRSPSVRPARRDPASAPWSA
jgi:catechol 2,3-dioxygenase-like lactoylglutathione lyase family enzyme